MTHDEENTARELIASAFADIAKAADRVNSPSDLARFVAKSLRDETELFAGLKDANEACLFSIGIHQHGTSPNDETMNLGSLEIEILAKVRHDNSPLLGYLNNPKKHYAYALALVTERDDEAALLLIMGTRDRRRLFALAIENEADAHAWQDDDDDTDREMPADLRATVNALTEAAAR